MPENSEEQHVTRPFWSGTITFGLVTIPVNLYPANRGIRVSLRMLGPSGKPLARRYYSDKSGRDLEDDDIVRGYEIKKNRFIEIADEELERLAPEKSRDIKLQSFVSADSIPRLFFERGYVLTPAGSARAYHLLAETMRKTKRAGIATFVMRGKEYLVAISADSGILRAETMRFHDEIRSPKQVGLPRPQKPNTATVRLFERQIQQRSRAALPAAALHDKAADRFLKMVRSKGKRTENIVGEPQRGKAKAQVIDLVEVLRESLGRSASSSRKRAAR